MQTQQAFSQIRTSEGFLKGKALSTPTLAMWTMSLWESEAALQAFYLTGSH
jgi:heme-degrading monooxygenase HmoA